MSKEIELKFSMPESLCANDVFGSIGLDSEIREIKMKSTYFDTKNNLLGYTKTSLRHRMENDVSVFTVKTPISGSGALAQRGEWQVEAKTLDEALPKLLAQGVPADIIAISKTPLVTVAEFEFSRQCGVLKTDSFSAELCVDIGYLSPDGVKKAPLREIELELISGEITALCAYGEELKERFSLVPQTLSKLARARNLK